ncbi:MAG: hypothetical protein EBR53_07245, partial [Actinobacteria bacterium]|nr:hypothetical protein [Actinomycetota bacterium]
MNHIRALNGLGYGPGCHHHSKPDANGEGGLEVLCRAHHAEIHEDSVSAAAREAEEEAGISAAEISVRDVFSDDHGPWRYDTVIAHTSTDAGAHAANAESEDLR